MAFISNGTTVASGGSLQNIPAPTSSQVMSAYASGVSGTNVVGAYGFLGRNQDVGIGNNDITPGSNYAGSYFRYASASGARSGSPTPAGTWKLLGRSENNAGNEESRTSLWFRYV